LLPFENGLSRLILKLRGRSVKVAPWKTHWHDLLARLVASGKASGLPDS
jgi:hypothetical protein